MRASLKEVRLQVLFSAFPGGITGVSLLVLRAVLGIAVLTDGLFCVREPSVSVSAWLLGGLAIACGGMLILGYLTPFVGMVVGLGAIACAISLFPVCTPNVFDSKPAVVFALTMVLTVVGSGPGRYSVDASLFGRREIIIPPREFQSEQ